MRRLTLIASGPKFAGRGTLEAQLAASVELARIHAELDLLVGTARYVPTEKALETEDSK